MTYGTVPGDRRPSDETDIDDIHGRCLVIYLIQDPDIAGVQPEDASATPGNRAIRIRLVRQRGDGMTRSREGVFVLAADESQGTERRLAKDDGQARPIVSASIRSRAASSSSRPTPPRPAALSAKCAASAARSSRSARSSMLISATTGLPCSLMVTGRWVYRASATSSPR